MKTLRTVSFVALWMALAIQAPQAQQQAQQDADTLQTISDMPQTQPLESIEIASNSRAVKAIVIAAPPPDHPGPNAHLMPGYAYGGAQMHATTWREPNSSLYGEFGRR